MLINVSAKWVTLDDSMLYIYFKRAEERARAQLNGGGLALHVQALHSHEK